MSAACRHLFEYASQHVSHDDILAFCPNDPGYTDYVKEMTAILTSGVIPSESSFEISETVGLNLWSTASEILDPRFRRFRIFTNAVGFNLCAGKEGPHEAMVPNYLCVTLIEDAHALDDKLLLQILPAAFDEIHQCTVNDSWVRGQSPFLLLGQLVLAFMGYPRSTDVEFLADQLCEEESKNAGTASTEFLWGCTFFDSLHHRWKHLVSEHLPANAGSDSISLLRSRLLAQPGE